MLNDSVDETLRIIVDDREKTSGIVGLLEKRNIEVSLKRLRCGDYYIQPDWVIERKTALDFNQSIIDGRLFRQIARLKRFYNRPFLLIEGNPFQTPIKIDPRAIKGAILTIQSVWYLPVIHSKSIQATCEILNTLALYALAVDGRYLARGGYKPKHIRTRQIYFLSSLPGIGPVLAHRLLKHCNTINNIIAANPKELVQVEGIGPKTASAIRTLLDTPYFFK
jgi:DNA excision repair protein ERCC-4